MTRACTVVIPTVRPVERLRQSLPTVARACAVAGLESAQVVLVDDSGERRPVVEEYADELGFSFVSSGGRGSGGARNLGADRAAKADLLIFIDDDIALDPASLVAATDWSETAPTRCVALLGGLRPPPGCADWLRWTYEDGILTKAAALAGPGTVAPVGFAAALAVVRGPDFRAAAGFPELSGWGGEDSVLGLRLGAIRGPGAELYRDPQFSGVHLYEPTWHDWLERSWRSGHRLVEFERELPPAVVDTLREAHGLGRGARPALKKALGMVPPSVWHRARGRKLRRLAAAGMEARGFRAASRGEITA